MKKLFYYSAVLLLAFSCSEDSKIDTSDAIPNEITSYKISPNEAQDLVIDFLNVDEENVQTRNGEMRSREISSIGVLRNSGTNTRSQTIKAVTWVHKGVGGRFNLDWDRIISDCKKNNGSLTQAGTETSLEEVSQLCKYLAYSFDAKYKTNVTSVNEDKPIKWFNKHGKLKATKLREYNEGQIINSIKNGNPVYGRGNSGKRNSWE